MSIRLSSAACSCSASALLSRSSRSWISAALFAGLVSLANRDWQVAGAGDAEAMLAAFDRYADQLGPGLFGHWNAGDR